MPKRSPSEVKDFLDAQAKRMRANPTSTELALMAVLTQEQGWTWQHPIQGTTKNEGNWHYVLDAWHAKAKLCIEVDGGGHYKRRNGVERLRGRDRRRDTRLNQLGIKTIRFTNGDVKRGMHQVVLFIEAILEERLKCGS